MWCIVSQANSVVLEVEVDQKADGQKCLDKICERLGILESDYFGLQYKGNKGEQLWLNLRNRIDQQLLGQPPYRLQLRVKFFVPPHYLIQDATKHQFYLQVKQDLEKKHLQMDSWEQNIRVAALVAQAGLGDDHNITDQMIYVAILNSIGNYAIKTSNLAQEHKKLRGMKKEQAEYLMLEEVSRFQNYGIMYHEAKNYNGEARNLGVGPKGINIYDENWSVIESIEFDMMHMATLAGKCVFLQVMHDNGASLGLKLVSQKAAKALYRCVTETHSFYRCNTVRNIVSAQFCRDLKGTVASLFNEHTSLGKSYIFDIKRTSMEVQDHVRRILYKRDTNIQDETSLVEDGDNSGKDDNEDMEKGKMKSRFEESFTCRICMDLKISTVLCPCGHLVCCGNCSILLQLCPLCRSAIEHVQKVYLPLPQFGN